MLAEQILQHEAADARAGIHDRQDEQRLEHDGEVIPEAEKRPPPPGEDMRHAEGQ